MRRRGLTSAFAIAAIMSSSGGGISPGDPLLDFAEGSFGRATVGTYQTAAATVAAAAIDELRYEDRGDGNGAVALFEGARTNWLERSEDLELTWSALNGLVFVADQDTSPRGDATADEHQHAADANSQSSITTPAADVPDGTTLCHTVWGRCASSTEIMRWQLVDKSAASNIQSDQTVTTTWQRLEYTLNAGTGASAPAHRIKNGSDGAARNVYFWGAQMEFGAYPTSYIVTGLGTVDRDEDSLTFLPAQVPLYLRESGSKWDVYPLWSASDLASGDIRVIASFGDSDNVLRVRHTGTDVRVEVVVGGVVKASSNALMHSRHDKLSITIDPVAATVDVNASTGSAGTAWAYPGGVALRVGGVLGANDEFDGRIAPPVAA